MNKLLFAFATLAAVVTGSPVPQLGGSYSAPGFGGGSSGGGFISGGSSGGGFISGGSSGGGFISGGSSGGGFISGGSSGGGFISGGGSHGGGGGGGAGGSISFGDGCGGGQIRSANGGCITPQITRNLYLYSAPQQTVQTLPPSHIPNPKVHLLSTFSTNAQMLSTKKSSKCPPTPLNLKCSSSTTIKETILNSQAVFLCNKLLARASSKARPSMEVVELPSDPSVVDLSVVDISVVDLLVEVALVEISSLMAVASMVEAPVVMVINLFSEWKISSYSNSQSMIYYSTYLFICMTYSTYAKNCGSWVS